MPVYVFDCDVCGATFERESHMNDDLSDVTCSNGHKQVHRIYSVPSVIYKGSGFYVNDSRSKPPMVSHDQRT